MKSYLPLLCLLVMVLFPGIGLNATPAERDWMILHFQYEGTRPNNTIDPRELKVLSTRPRIYSGLLSRLIRIRLANGETIDAPGSHPLRLASGAWRRPGQLKPDDRIRYGARLIRVGAVRTLERERPVRLYVIESPGTRNDFRLSAGRLTEDARDLALAEAEDNFCPGRSCRKRLGLLNAQPSGFSGAAWFSSFFAIQDFSGAYAALNSSSRRSRRKAVEWIQRNGSPEQRALLKIFAHNAGWRGMGLSSDEYYRNFESLLALEADDPGSLTALERELLRHHFGREVDRPHVPANQTNIAEVAEPTEGETSSGPEIDWPAIGRSVLLPGWGNTYLGHERSGYTYSGLFLGSAAFAYYEYDRAINSAALYREQALRADIITLALAQALQRDTTLIQILWLNQDANATLRSTRRSAFNAIGAIQFAGLVYAASLLHVTPLAISWPESESAHVLIQPAPTGDALQFSFVVAY